MQGLEWVISDQPTQFWANRMLGLDQISFFGVKDQNIIVDL